MADTKISALPASTTPLAGTEVLPIVQSGVTRQVSVANLTAGRALSATELTLSTGNLIIGTSGKGVDFSATPGTGTSELLADYEEGTFTPTILGATSPGVGTYTTQVGFYTKIGDRVFYNLSLNWSAHTGTGNMNIEGLPFTSSSAADNYSAVSIMPSNIALSANNMIYGIVVGTKVLLYQALIGGGNINTVAVDPAGLLYVSGHYEV